MDSGAYSAWRSGKPVDLLEYCGFLEANASWLGPYINLDWIDPHDPEAAARTSFDNLRVMQKRGLKPIPVFHIGENIDWLHRILDTGADYIALAGLSMAGSRSKWYESIWSELVDGAGNPLLKVHALGDSRPVDLLRFPWHSADSASWLYAAQRTGVMTIDDVRYSHRNDGLHTSANFDINRLDGSEKTAFHAALAEYGIDPEGFAELGHDSWVLRTYLALKENEAIQARVQAAHPIRKKSAGLFFLPDFALPRKSGLFPAQRSPMRLHLVMGNNEAAMACAAFAGYESTLQSYFYLKSRSWGRQFAEFAYHPLDFCRKNVNAAKALATLERYVHVPSGE